MPQDRIDFEGSLARFVRWGGDPVNVVAEGSYFRVIRSGRRLVPYQASQAAGGAIEVSTEDQDSSSAAIEDIRTRLGARLPAEALAALGRNDRVLRPLIARLGGRRPPIEPDAFESLVTSITAQQVNLSWARTTRSRLVHRFGRKRRFKGMTLWAFPSPRSIASASAGEIRALQFTWRKSEYMVGLAEAAVGGVLEGMDRAPDGEVIERLMAIRGVGRWTADWFLARHLARPGAVAAGDLGVRKAVGQIYLGQVDLPSEDEVRRLAADWGDAANWATHILLEALAETSTP